MFQDDQEIVRNWYEIVRIWYELAMKVSGKCGHQLENDLRYWKWPKIARKWSGNGLKWSELVWNGLKLSEIVPWSNIVQDDPRWFIMVQDGPRFQNGQRCLKHWKKYTLHTYGPSAEGAKAGGEKKKRSTILPISLVQSFFCVLFFSLCSNLSIWPGRQVVPDESRCYIPIYDGLV